jgi:hypothetical protein
MNKRRRFKQKRRARHLRRVRSLAWELADFADGMGWPDEADELRATARTL